MFCLFETLKYHIFLPYNFLLLVHNTRGFECTLIKRIFVLQENQKHRHFENGASRKTLT